MTADPLALHHAPLQPGDREPGLMNEARRRRVPSKTTLAGLIKHMIGVERGWFQEVLAGRNPEDIDPNVGGHADILREQTDGAAGIDGDSAVATWLHRIVVNAAPR